MSIASTPFCSVMTTVSGPISGASVAADGIDVVQLHREQHDINRTDRLRPIGGLHFRQMHVALRARDVQAVVLHRREMRAAREEGDVLAAAARRPPK